MDAIASKEYGFINKGCKYNANFNFNSSTSLRGKPSVKYAKLPDFDFDTRAVSWSRSSYILPPRLRRIIELEDPNMIVATRSLKIDNQSAALPQTSYTRRKIVTIMEDDESEVQKKIMHSFKQEASAKTVNRSASTENRDKNSSRQSSRASYMSKPTKSNKRTVNPKINDDVEKEVVNKIKINNSKNNNLYSRNRSIKEKDSSITGPNNQMKINQRRQQKSISDEKKLDVDLLKNKIIGNMKNNNLLPKKSLEKNNSQQKKSKFSFWDEIKAKNKAVLIHTPLEKKYFTEEEDTVNPKIHKEDDRIAPSNNLRVYVDSSTDYDRIAFRDAYVKTDDLINKVDQDTEIDFETILTCEKSEFEKRIEFDCLDIPKVTLIKDNSNEESLKFHSKSLPSLKTSSNSDEDALNSNVCKTSSFIIGRATLTYTTKQKINIHVVSSNEDTSPCLSPSPLAYPLNVVSVFKKIKSEETNSSIINQNDKYNQAHSLQMRESCIGRHGSSCSLNANNILLRSSDKITSIRINSDLLKNDHMSEQFFRELNFIDSFIESLQYLENCSITDKRFSDKCESYISDPTKEKTECQSFLSSLENDANIDDSETMASKSLCLLNLLIRDEQRRAKDLLFVLKMREEALTDFTKSHILWLENKKKQENTDISTLKKKQRGALVKLQSECGEMQRMRKALLAISEKRKAALIKTKNNIELKLKDTVDVDRILFNKRKLKKTVNLDRNTAPLKCFELSSSGCEDSSSIKTKIDKSVLATEINNRKVVVTSAEKSVQTGDSLLCTVLTDDPHELASENCVAVDGTYLNILFQNLTLPKIFSNGKQYEVNEEALKNIVNSSNLSNDEKGNPISENPVEYKSQDQDRSSSPSTAHSLVEELDEYYKGMIAEVKSLEDSTDTECNLDSTCKIQDIAIVLKSQESNTLNLQETEINDFQSDVHSNEFLKIESERSEGRGTKSKNIVEPEVQLIEIHKTEIKKSEDIAVQAGPLTRPVGAAKILELLNDQKGPSVESSISNSQDTICSASDSEVSITSIDSPTVHCEAEELRRQQLAIEQEIKALEQQESQLMVVREIPDKPPPPYTPPTEIRIPKVPRPFYPDDVVKEKVESFIADPESIAINTNDTFEVFLKDYCLETLERNKVELSEKPWDACNILPQKLDTDANKLTKNAANDLVDVLTPVQPTHIAGVSTRRSDHIDDILFAEWRRCEPEWTSLHVDEVVVKNQVFESIFQQLLTDTVDQYKKMITSNTPPDLQE